MLYYPNGRPDAVYHMPDTVETIAEGGMMGIGSLEEVYISKSLKELPYNIMGTNYKLRAVYFPGNALSTYKPGAFVDASEDLLIYRVEGSTGWDVNGWASMNFATWNPKDSAVKEGTLEGGVTWKFEASVGRLTLSGTGEKMPDYAVNEEKPWQIFANDIQTVVVKGVLRIGNYTFYQAKNLKRVDVDDAFAEIGSHAFDGCTELLYFNNILMATRVEDYAFYGDLKLQSDLLLNRLVTLGYSAFAGCSSVSFATFGPGCDMLTNRAFDNCTGLQYLILPETMTQIGVESCANCTALESVNIPTGVTVIGRGAFKKSGLQAVYFYGDVPASWEESSFQECSQNMKICYRTGKKGWEELGGAWNGYGISRLSRFYTGCRDDYMFPNSRGSFGYPMNHRISVERYNEILHNLSLANYYHNIYTWNGSCFGMAVSSLAYYGNGNFLVSDFDPGKNLYSLPAPGSSELTKIIETYQLTQCLPIFAGTSGALSRNRFNYGDLIRAVEEFERTGGPAGNPSAEPIILSVYANYSGHTLVPVSVDVAVNGDYHIKVYDCNKPGSLRTVIISGDLKRLSYGKYTQGSYIGYFSYEKGMKKALGIDAAAAVSEEKDDSVYLSVNRENVALHDAEGKTLDEIEGAYEQKFMSDAEEGGEEEEEKFPGIRSFVLPAGNYEISEEHLEDQPEVQTETSKEDLVYYMAAEDIYVDAKTTNKDAALQVGISENGDRTFAPVQPENPGETETPGGTEEPGGTETPGGTEEPGGTETPGGTEEPGGTENSGETENPEKTEGSSNGSGTQTEMPKVEKLTVPKSLVLGW